jgi:hypothetical protein
MTTPPAVATAPARPDPGPRFVARWDLDKTYLRTDFDTLRDLVRTAIERPDRKRSVPGAAALLRELGQTGARIHILSGSPRQMKSRLEEKLLIDRVRWDELTLKPNLSNIVRLRLRALRDQLGYKLPMLLDARARDQASTRDAAALREVLVGDDAEADAFVYSLYADVLAGQVEERVLRRVLEAGRVYSDAVDVCRAALARIERAPVVERILIHLDLQTPPSRFDDYGSRVVPFYNYVQAAFVLAEDGHLDAAGVLRVASELVLRHRFDADALARSYLDLMRRGHVNGKIVEPLGHAAAALASERRPASIEALLRMCEILVEYLRAPPAPRAREPIELDYVALAAKHRGGKNRRKRR